MDTFHFWMNTFRPNITGRDTLHWIKIVSQQLVLALLRICDLKGRIHIQTHTYIHIYDMYKYNICMNSNNLNLLIWAFLSRSRSSIFVFSNMFPTIPTLLCETQMKHRRDILTMLKSYCSEIVHIDAQASPIFPLVSSNYGFHIEFELWFVHENWSRSV